MKNKNKKPIFVYNEDFEPCKDFISLKNLQVSIFKHGKKYCCKLNIRNEKQTKEVSKDLVLKFKLNEMIDPVGIHLKDFLDDYTCFCTLDEGVLPTKRRGRREKKVGTKTKKKKIKKVKKVRKKKKDETKKKTSGKKKQSGKKRKRKEDDVEEPPRKKHKPIEPPKKSIEDNKILEQIQLLLKDYENPVFYLPATLSVIFEEIFSQSFENIEKMTKKQILDQLQKIYPHIFI